MDIPKARPRRRVGVWILIGFLALVGGGLLWATREPPTPYGFLNKHPIAERRESKDGKLRIVVLKADIEDVWRDIQAEFAGKPVFSSIGYVSVNGLAAEYKSLGTDEGLIKISNDLSFANGGYDGHSLTVSTPEVKPGYCAVAFTRPKTLFDKAMEWMHGFFGGSKSKPQEQPTSPPPRTIRV